jgi:hypothetical protein
LWYSEVQSALQNRGVMKKKPAQAALSIGFENLKNTAISGYSKEGT